MHVAAIGAASTEEKSVSVSVSDDRFIDRSEVNSRGTNVIPVSDMLEPPSPTMVTAVDHTAAYRIHAQLKGGNTPLSCVVFGEWQPLDDGRLYFSPSGVMQNACRVGSAPDFRLSPNRSLRALAGQLVTEFALPPQRVLDKYRN